MAQRTLLLVEASGIQNYIFGSNQLAQNIGASELVRRATENWVEALTTKEQRVYIGGGNAMLLFDTEGQADAFARKLTRRALEETPGLQLVVARQTFEPGQLRETHQDLRGKLAQRKLARRPSTPLLGLGVTTACVYTGAPAVEVRDEQLISAEVKAKLSAMGAGKDQLKEHLKQVEKAGYDFVDNFDDFGSKGESSYLAVIHTDGNRMGERIQASGEKSSSDETYIQALQDFSASVREAAQKALSSTADLLLWATDPREQKIAGVVPIHDYRLPFRPIVFGGDDVTFVCEGRLGLAVAAHYLRVFSEQVLSDGEYAHARAGIAVVKSHYPFSRAYELAGALAASAKGYIKEAKMHCTALDWHFAVSGLVLPLKKVREREYTVPNGSLLIRPLRISPSNGDWRMWETFTGIMAAFNKDPWAGRRNKIKALREALRGGKEAVQHFLAAYTDLEQLPPIAGLATIHKDGWQGKRCGYFDAVEALDFFVPLEEE